MELQQIIDIISTLGFPVACVIGLGWFIYKIYTDTTKQNNENMEKVQSRCKEREDKLYEQLEKQNEINGKAIATITLYAEKLEAIQEDVREIKTIVLEKK